MGRSGSPLKSDSSSLPVEEMVIGEIPVIARLRVGSERLSLFVTRDRMIVARVGKRGVGSMTAFPLYSILTGGMEVLFRWRKESSTHKRATASLTPQAILDSDKENFPVGYDEIVSVELVETPIGRTSISIVTRDDKLLFTTGLSFEKVLGLLSGRVGSRLVVKRKST